MTFPAIARVKSLFLPKSMSKKLLKLVFGKPLSRKVYLRYLDSVYPAKHRGLRQRTERQ
jgi:hypothetical protein